MKGFRGVGLALVAMGLLVGTAARAGDEEKKLNKAVEQKVDYIDQLTRFETQQISLAKVALERSQSPRVREFANRLIKDHEGSMKTLRTWAQGRALQIAALAEETSEGTGGSGQVPIAQQSPENQAKANEQSLKAEQTREELGRVEPEKFDKEFLSKVIESQEQGKELLKKGRDEFKGDITFASVLAKNQPVVESHVAMAKSLKDML